ncbi:MAG: hypothetical protein K9M99_11765 [Candidatus Cloacimonetes bacterium]|nr:hypothetical protein [Candidatus Cloacimonadota bacterium]
MNNKYYFLVGFNFTYGRSIVLDKKEMERRNKTIDNNRDKPFTNLSLISFDEFNEVIIANNRKDKGNFVIKAESMKKAYQIANIIRSFFSLVYDYSPVEYDLFFLQEMNNIPDKSWTDRDLRNEIKEVAGIKEECDLIRIIDGYEINDFDFNEIISFLKIVFSNDSIRRSIENWYESISMVGILNSCYGNLDNYLNERPNIVDWLLEKRYLECKLKYDTAFLTAFKGIEIFFNKVNIKKRNIDFIIKKSQFSKVFKPSTKYKCTYLTSKPKECEIQSIICKFLDQRNVVAAHGNLKPPDMYQIKEDDVFEIQYFLKKLILDAYRYLETKSS